MKCTGSRRYDQLKTGFQPDTVHATSPVSSLEQATELPQNRPGATMALNRTVGRLRKQQTMFLCDFAVN